MKTIVVAGHVCLDIIPAFPNLAASLDTLFVPGKLIDVGPARLSTGGVVGNTGLALHRLGVPVRPVAKIGDDAFGRAVRDIFQSAGAPTGGLKADAAAATSYSVVLNPAGYDRIFLHCPSANDLFGADDLADAVLPGASLLHFGYPPLMRRMYEDGGEELRRLLIRAKTAGLTTSLDLALPDPLSPAGRVDWPNLLERVLPHVDCLTPSLDEIVFMLERSRFESVRLQTARGVPLGGLSGADVARLADRLLEMGPAILLLKLGPEGLYLQATRSRERLLGMGGAAPDAENWQGVSGHAPCFEVEARNTTGAGDRTIAGFLAALVRGLGPEEACRMAVANGAASVEQAGGDAGLPGWEALIERRQRGWRRRQPRVILARVM